MDMLDCFSVILSIVCWCFNYHVNKSNFLFCLLYRNNLAYWNLSLHELSEHWKVRCSISLFAGCASCVRNQTKFLWAFAQWFETKLFWNVLWHYVLSSCRLLIVFQTVMTMFVASCKDVAKRSLNEKRNKMLPL